MLQIIDKEDLLGALIGLVKACQTNMKMDGTDLLIIDGLLTVADDSNQGISSYAVMYNKVKEEKNLIAPNCSVCPNPCGNTDDYDLREMYSGDKEICDLKLKLLDVAIEVARAISKDHLQDFESDAVTKMEYVCKALAVMSYDSTAEHIGKIIAEGKKLIEQ